MKIRHTIRTGAVAGVVALLSISMALADPELDNISPDSGEVGGPAFTLTASGQDFVPGSVIRWNGSDRPTTFIDNETLTAEIPAPDLSARGSVDVTVFEPDGSGGGVSSGAETFQVNLVPSISSLSPDSVAEDSGAFTLTVNGSNFAEDSQVRWNGDNRSTTFVNANTLTAQINGGDVNDSGTAQVTVFNPNPGGTSNSAAFTIIGAAANPVPSLSQISPDSAPAGSPGFTLTVTGSNFVPGAVVRWEGGARGTTFVNDTTLTAQIPASDLLLAGTFAVTVFNPSPGGGASGAISFTVTPPAGAPNPDPVLVDISPEEGAFGGPAFTLTATGTGFVPGSIVRWNGSDRPTTFVNGTTLTAEIPASDLTIRGDAQVTIFTPAPGGGTSDSRDFRVQLVPVIMALSPSVAPPGSPGFALTVSGANFAADSVVRWEGSNRPTTFVNDATLTAAIPAQDLRSLGNFSVTVFNSDPGGLSNAAVFSVTDVPNPAPTLTSISPVFAEVGQAGITLTAQGRDFTPSSVIQWNGENRRSTFVDSRTLTADIPASDLAARAFAEITVFTPPVGGGISDPRRFAVRLIPRLTGIDPSSTTAANLTFMLTVTGTNFEPDSEVRWNAARRPTTFISPTSLTASIVSDDFAAMGPYQVTVFNPEPGGVSNAILFNAELEAVRVYPNPWRADRHSALAPSITFDRMNPGSQVKIFSLSGQWLKTIEAAGGIAVWDLKDEESENVASGFYLYYITGTDGKNRRGKISVLR